MTDAATARGLQADWHAVVSDWRGRSMKEIVGQVRPDFNMDEVLGTTLNECLVKFALDGLDEAQRCTILRAWHELDAWPGFPQAMKQLHQSLPVVSLTMLPTALVVGVSRRNGLAWDVVISCEMIDVYKPHAQAYETAARWLAPESPEILMVACHNFELKGAHNAGRRTAFVRRPAEWGPAGPPDPNPNTDYDVVVSDFGSLVQAVQSSR
ncbi:MAG: hypothetical protein ABIR55_10535 [Burkholderiaceae bacterium]